MTKNSLPKISVVLPSFNQVKYLESTILSVLDQKYPNLEFIIIDGGSTDGSKEIIEKYAKHIDYWVSEADLGQSHAINKGLKRATGDWVCWQNSDDIFYPFAFELLAKAINKNPNLDFIIGDINLIDENDLLIRSMRYVRPTYKSLLAEGMVLTNQAAFWRRDLHTKIGWLNESLHYGFDYEWFLRILSLTSHSFHISAILGALRLHAETKTSLYQQRFYEEYQHILSGRTLPNWHKYLFKFRRLLLTLKDGHFRYVLNGLIDRVACKRNSRNPLNASEP